MEQSMRANSTSIQALFLALLSIGLSMPTTSAHAACAEIPFANGTTADADQLNNYLQCLAPLNSPNFTGDVGIGTTAPVSLLHLADTSTAGGELTIESDYATSARAGINFNTPYQGTMHTGSITSSFYSTPGMVLTAPRDLASLGTYGIAFNSNSGATRMFIDSNYGRVGIGTMTPSYLLYVNGTSGGTNEWTSTSDARLKKNILPIKDALTVVENLQGVQFQWRGVNERTVGKTLKLSTDTKQIGFIAQDVRKVVPEAVTVSRDPDAILGVQEAKLTPILVEAVKQLAALNKAQSLKISQLERRLSAVERKDRVRTADDGRSAPLLSRQR